MNLAEVFRMRVEDKMFVDMKDAPGSRIVMPFGVAVADRACAASLRRRTGR